MEEVLRQIADNLAKPSAADWIMVIITGVYVLATIAICYFNKKSADAAHEQAKQAQKALQKSVDLQLFDRMIAVSNKLENDDYSSSTMEISVLFGLPIWKQVESLKRLTSELDSWKFKEKKYNELCVEQGYDYNLAQEAEIEGADEKTIQEAQAQDEKYSIIYDYDSYDPYHGIEADKYDWKEISTTIKNLKEQIQKEQKQLKNDVYEILKSKITIE